MAHKKVKLANAKTQLNITTKNYPTLSPLMTSARE